MRTYSRLPIRRRLCAERTCLAFAAAPTVRCQTSTSHDLYVYVIWTSTSREQEVDVITSRRLPDNTRSTSVTVEFCYKRLAIRTARARVRSRAGAPRVWLAIRALQGDKRSHARITLQPCNLHYLACACCLKFPFAAFTEATNACCTHYSAGRTLSVAASPCEAIRLCF